MRLPVSEITQSASVAVLVFFHLNTLQACGLSTVAPVGGCLAGRIHASDTGDGGSRCLIYIVAVVSTLSPGRFLRSLRNRRSCYGAAGRCEDGGYLVAAVSFWSLSSLQLDHRPGLWHGIGRGLLCALAQPLVAPARLVLVSVCDESSLLLAVDSADGAVRRYPGNFAFEFP